MTSCLTVIPRKRETSSEEIKLKQQVGLVPIEMVEGPFRKQHAYLLQREVGIKPLQVGTLCFFLHKDERYLMRVADMGSCHSGEVAVPVFEFVRPDDCIRRKVLLDFKGCALGEKKGARLFIYRDNLSVVARKCDLSKSEIDFLEWDVSDVDVNEKVYADEINIPSFAHLLPGHERLVIMECKYRFRSESLLEVFQKQQLMWSA